MEKIFQYQGINTSYRITGKGKPVLLLHGFGEDGSIWDLQLKALQINFQVIVPELPGSGKSEILENKETSIIDYADWLHELIKHEKIEKPILLGHSMGGYISLAFAGKYQDDLSALGLINSTAFADTEEKKETRRKGIKFIEENDAYSFLKTTIPNLFSEFSKTNIAEKINQVIAKTKNFSKEALIQYYYAMINRKDTTDILSKIKVPVLFIMGTEDIAAPLNDVIRQVHLPNTSFIHIMKNVGHMSMVENPDQLNFYLETFCQAVQKNNSL